jgi:hypothetical protein
MKDAIGLIIIIALIIYACSPGKLEERPDYKKGYEDGYDAGVENQENETCDKIKSYSYSIYGTLRSENICP